MQPSEQPGWFVPTLQALLDGQNLRSEQMATFVEALIQGQCGDVEAASLLIALRMKGETAEELASAARVIRQHCRPLHLEHRNVLDTCGTGGDGLGTFNISTATALVVAAAGVPVVKHGNRAVSSKSGSADVLAELGVHIQGDPESARRCLDRAGMAFCLAPVYHPSLRHVASVRRTLGVRTLFNCLGPLANPAGARFQLLGVGRREWLDPMAEALAKLGSTRTLLVHGHDGLDEVSLCSRTMVRLVDDSTVTPIEWCPEDFGLDRCAITDLQANDATQSAKIIHDILDGRDSPATQVVLANAAAALLIVTKVQTLIDGVALARQAIHSGKAMAVLQALREQSQL